MYNSFQPGEQLPASGNVPSRVNRLSLQNPQNIKQPPRRLTVSRLVPSLRTGPILRNSSCSLSLWRVARGSKLTLLELIHGLFITQTEFRLSTTFIPAIIIMHIYNWYQSSTTVILLCTRIQNAIYMARSPCFLSPLADSLLLPFPTPFYLLGTLLAVTGSVHLGLRLLVN